MANGTKRRGSLLTPPSSSKRLRRGGSYSRGAGRMSSVASRIGAAAGSRLLAKVPYVGPLVRAAMAGRTAYKIYKGARGRSSTGRKGETLISKNAGYFKKGSAVTTNSDKYSVPGFVEKLEWSGTVKDEVNQVVYVAHTTLPAQTVAYATMKSLVKKLLIEAKHSIKNQKEIICAGQYYYSQISLYYKVKDGDVVTEKIFAITTSTTFEDVSNAMFNWFMSLSETSNLPNQLLFLRYYVNVALTGTALLLQAELDLSTAKIQLYGKSQLKIQNRTVTAASNNNADDVDNVPLDGRSFEYATNSTIYRDFGEPTTATVGAITTSPYFGVLPTFSAATGPVTTGTSMYADMPDRTQFIGCKKMAKTQLDPGTIKTSVLNDTVTMPLNKLISTIFGRKPNTGTGRTNQYWIGRTRLFAWEKMINIAGDSASASAFNLACEHQYEVGAIAVVQKKLQTAPGIQVSTATVN